MKRRRFISFTLLFSTDLVRTARSMTMPSSTARTTSRYFNTRSNDASATASNHDNSIPLTVLSSSSSPSSYDGPSKKPAKKTPIKKKRITKVSSSSSSSTTRQTLAPRTAKSDDRKSTLKHVVQAPPAEGLEEVKDVVVVERTKSFQPVSDYTFHPDSNMKIHTLLLGTHPSVQSLAQSRYYGHPMNAFWWIAGDNLGFRRDTGISQSSGKPYQFTKHLYYEQDKILPYEKQLETLTSHGFALWDILQSCKRKGSLDNDIKEEIPNNIRDFCTIQHPSIKRIVLMNGTSSAIFFNRYFKEWWLSNELKPGANKESIKAFKKFERMKEKKVKKGDREVGGGPELLTTTMAMKEEDKIECICGLGVSPAAAIFSYVEKRDFYKEHCYIPALEDHKRLNGGGIE